MSICDICGRPFACGGGKDTSATIFRTLIICVDLCNLWETLSSRFCEFCVFCGHLRTLTICADLCNLWEALSRRNFCEFCVFCGRHFDCGGGKDTSATILRNLTSVSICEICGRPSVAGSVNSACSVGGTLIAAEARIPPLLSYAT